MNIWLTAFALVFTFGFAQTTAPTEPPSEPITVAPGPVDQGDQAFLESLVLLIAAPDASNAIVAQIDAATSHIYLLAPTIVSSDIKDALLRAQARGVDTAFIVDGSFQTPLTAELVAAGIAGRALPGSPEHNMLLVDNRYLTVGPALAGETGELQIVDLGTGADTVIYALASAFQHGTPIN